MPPRIDTLARRYTETLPADDVAALVAKVREKARRLQVINECPTPADVGARFDHTFVRTPAVDLVSARLQETVTTRDGRLVVSVPPQEMKTSLLRLLAFWLLIDDPDRRIVFASYAAGLARTSGRMIRGLVETHGHQVGLEVDRSHADASDWQLAGHRGGLLSVGVGGSLTGRPSDVLLVDDPLRNQQDANSPTIVARLHEWWEAVARTRLAPGAPVVVVQTRWAMDDLAGRMIDQGWPLVNIPALADGETPDALQRAPGEYLVSTRGRTPADWESIRRDVGERVWAALFQGRPAPLEGGVFKQAWFDLWRVPELPAGCLPPVVVVDPADNPGSGDEAGIMVGAAHPASGKGYLLDDLSGPMTVGQWTRVALLTCVRRGAPTLAFEKSLSQLTTRIREAWATLHQQATALHAAKGDIEKAVTRLSRADDSGDIRDRLRHEVTEIVGDYQGILAVGRAGPRIKPLIAKGSKTARMLLVAPTFETGRMCMVGRHAAAEHQASVWQEGQDSPDRVDTMVHLAALLTGISGVASLGTASGERIPTRSTSRTAGGARIGRSTGRRR